MCPFANDADATFVERVCSWIEPRIWHSHRWSFGALVASLPGVDPSVVATALTRLSTRNGEVAQAAAALLVQAADLSPTRAPTTETPIPHPLEFYWGYTDDSVKGLLLRVAHATGRGATIAYLGVPSVFRRATGSLPDRTHVLLDRNPRTVPPTGRVLRVDLLRDELPIIHATSAILDPPWYPEHMCSFLWAAATLVATGSDVWLSYPPVGTRPSVEREMTDVLNKAASYGFSVVGHEHGILRYTSPPFELAVHRAARLGGIPLDWRTADLLRLRLAQVTDHPRPQPPMDTTRWEAFSIRDIPLWVRLRPSADSSLGSNLLQSLVADDQLRSVSRRDPHRAYVDVWTSLNRVWRSSHPGVIARICQSLADGADSLVAVEAYLDRSLSHFERASLHDVTDRLRRVVQQEIEEHMVQSI
jgi:hypothetical protein